MPNNNSIFTLQDMLPFKRSGKYKIPGSIANPDLPDDNTNQLQDVPDFVSQYAQKLADLPEPEALNRYKQHLDQIPNRNDYQLGTGGKILAALTGALTGFSTQNANEGIKAAQGAIDRPYNRALQDFDMQNKALEGQAGIEKEQLANQRANIGEQANLGLKGQELGLQQTKAGQEQAHRQWEEQHGNQQLKQQGEYQKGELGLKGQEIAQTGALRKEMMDFRNDQFVRNQAKWHQSQYDKEIKPYQGEEIAYSNLATAANSANPIDRISALHSYIRDITQSAKAAGASGVQSYLKSLGASDRFNNFIANYTENQPIDDKTMKDILDSATNMHQSLEVKRNAIRNLHAKWATDHGFDPKDIMYDYQGGTNDNSTGGYHPVDEEWFKQHMPQVGK